MGTLPPSSFDDHFASLTDPRSSNARHELNDLQVIVVCAVICGSEGWEDLQEYGKAQTAWLKQISTVLYLVDHHPV